MESTPSDGTSAKRKRSPSISQPTSAPAAKVSKPANQLSINYLARQSNEDLPLINKDDTLPNLLHLLSCYSNILDRHESLASNLGARPLGPILIKRFERCFENPPKVVASHHKGGATNPDEGHQISWLEVIEFARSHPGQFTLSTFSEGKRVCQFYYPQKQLRVQISEEDFLFINSGRCQELIPPLPIWEDEEKEVGTCDVLEAKLKELTNAADMVAARTRQLGHRLKGRRAAILERRAEGGSGTPAKATTQQTTTAPPPSASGSGSGASFTPVNSNGTKPENTEPALGSSAAVRNELLRHFESLPQNQAQGRSQSRHHSIVNVPDIGHHSSKKDETGHDNGGAESTTSSLSPVPPNAFSNDISYYISDNTAPPRQPSTSNHRPSSSAGTHSYAAGHTPLKHNFSRPLPPALESSQPFRPLCQAHMDNLSRGQRVLPPCDRCRRLRMDCVKNLTSCAGCTRKHTRCHWRDVSREELGALDHLMESAYSGPSVTYIPADANGFALNGGSDHEDDPDDSDDDDSNPLEDLEALGEKEERENEAKAERMREDEEGLRKARELSRQGWEENLKSHRLSHQQEYGSGADEGDGIDRSDAAQKTRPDDDVQMAESTSKGDDEMETIHVLPPYGGFRAVNEPHVTTI